MKKIVFTLIIIILSYYLKGQVLNFSLDNIHNKQVINPAYSARNNFITFNLLYKKHWIYPGAPTHGTIWISGKLTQHMASGLQISSEQIGLFRKTMISFDYAYDIRLDRQTTHLSFGISGALIQDFFNINQAHILYQDPLLTNQDKFSNYYPQAAAGILLYSDVYEIGIAATQLLPYSNYSFSNYNQPLPPAIILHGIYYYSPILWRRQMAPEFLAAIRKDKIHLQTNLSGFFKKKTIKIGGGITGDYIFDYHTIKFGIVLYSGIKIAERYFISYQFDFHSINMPTPIITKLGNSISIRMDIYPHQYDMPEYF